MKTLNPMGGRDSESLKAPTEGRSTVQNGSHSYPEQQIHASSPLTDGRSGNVDPSAATLAPHESRALLLEVRGLALREPTSS